MNENIILQEMFYISLSCKNFCKCLICQLWQNCNHPNHYYTKTQNRLCVTRTVVLHFFRWQILFAHKTLHDYYNTIRNCLHDVEYLFLTTSRIATPFQTLFIYDCSQILQVPPEQKTLHTAKEFVLNSIFRETNSGKILISKIAIFTISKILNFKYW